MAGSSDCKTLLDTHEALQGRGPWKRVSKRNASDGVERIFTNADRSCFVRVLENHGTLLVHGIGEDLASVQGEIPVSPAPTPREPTYPLALFSLFPPDDGVSDEELLEMHWQARSPGNDVRAAYRKGFSGRLIYIFGEDDGDNGVPKEGEVGFMFGFETSDGFISDEHHIAIERLLAFVLGDFPNEFSFNVAESCHCATLEDGESDASLTARLKARFKKIGAVPIHQGSPLDKAPTPRFPASFFQPIFLEDGDTLVSVVERSRLDGKQLILPQWHHLAPVAQEALVRWAKKNAWQLHAVKPDSEAADALEQRLTALGYPIDAMGVAVGGALVSMEEAQRHLTGDASVLPGGRKSKPSPG